MAGSNATSHERRRKMREGVGVKGVVGCRNPGSPKA